MHIGIEFVSSMKIIDNIALYTGGTNYAKMILRALKENILYKDINITLIVPTRFKPTVEDKQLFLKDIYKLEYVSNLKEYDYSKLDVIFFPQVNGSTLKIIPKIKTSYPHVKIYATLHDRQHNFYKFDWYDRYYFNGIQRTGLPCFAEYWIKKLAFSYEFGKCVKYIDKVFTVSNFSMQKLMHKNIQEIKYYIQGNVVENFQSNKKIHSDYILFVGGGRPEKNLLRTLEAFSLFVNQTSSKTKLKITGINEKEKNNILRSPKIDIKVLNEFVEFLPYVSYQELASLYASCKYVVFTSKGEGYGLPIREAMNYGKTVLASRTTSIPEVAGAALYYVDPFNVNSICKGFRILDNEKNLSKYEKYIEERNKIIKKLSEQDTEIMIEELLNEY